MKERYYLALFNEDTWNEFLNKGSSVYGTTLKNQRRMEMINPSDFLVCYVSKLSRFVGLLEVSSKAYLDDNRIWEKDVYPVRVKVLPIYSIKAKNGIPVLELKEKLLMFAKLKSMTGWGILFRSSLTEFPEHDAKLIIEELKKLSYE